ncbi:MAG TPA: hypothetical protein VHE61_04695 [Opitutaceae bacterium]|nr:hypothetical protein [Opitutaceae bacterium]
MLALAATAPVHAVTWLKLQTEDVVIYSDASSKDVVEFAIGYSAYRHVFKQLLAPRQKPAPATVLLFRRLGTLHDYVPRSTDDDSTTVSYNADVDGDELTAISVDGDRHTALRQMYEFDTVWELRRSGYALPIWMSQGAGEVLASLEVEKTKCVIGDGPDSYDETWSRGSNLAWTRFFDVSTDSPEYVGPQANGVFHAQAWALMHRVLLADDGGTARFVQLADKLRTEGGLDAVRSVLGVKERDLTTDIFRHRGRTREYPFDTAGLRSRLHPQPAPEAEVRVELANLLVAANKGAEAEQELARARTLAPDSPAVKEALARQAFRDSEPEYGIKLYRDAIAAGSTSPHAYLVSAKQRLDDNMTGGRDHQGDGSPGVEQAIDELHRALQLDPGSTEAYNLLGRAFFVRTTLNPGDVKELEPGIVSGTAGAAVRYYRALVYRRMGQHDAYAADLRAILADRSVSNQLRNSVREQLVSDEVNATAKEMDRLARLGKFDEARALIAKQEADPQNVDETDQYERMRAWLSENQDWNAVREAYDAKDWREVRTLVGKFMDKYPRSRLLPAARQVLNQAEQFAGDAAPAPKPDDASSP